MYIYTVYIYRIYREYTLYIQVNNIFVIYVNIILTRSSLYKMLII